MKYKMILETGVDNFLLPEFATRDDQLQDDTWAPSGFYKYNIY